MKAAGQDVDREKVRWRRSAVAACRPRHLQCGMATPRHPQTLLICTSVHHGNTAAVARAMAGVLGAEVAAPEAVPYTIVHEHDLLGFGSGVYYGRMHRALFTWLRGLPDATEPSRPAFVFSTSGLPFLAKAWHAPLASLLRRKGFDVVGEFACRGFDSWGPLWFVGGLNRRHPDERDLARAGEFARRLEASLPAERRRRAT